MKPPVKALLIYRKLKKAIVDGIYPPGSFLPNETALAVNFGVSRNTLRSALTRLAEEKFIRPDLFKRDNSMSPRQFNLTNSFDISAAMP